jgi:DNA-binding CsgD family transcriptional regulator
MNTFAQYFLERQLGEVEEGHLISESALKEGLLRKSPLAKHMRQKHLERFIEKFPDVQSKDMEDAFQNAIKKIMKEKPDSEKSAEILFAKSMEENLSDVSRNKRHVRGNLSCIKRIKSSAEGSIQEIMKRAESLLTGKEKKILDMCSQGKSVRVMAQETGMSHPTAWRTLNSAIDKIRMSHGMKPRHKDIRKKSRPLEEKDK